MSSFLLVAEVNGIEELNRIDILDDWILLHSPIWADPNSPTAPNDSLDIQEARSIILNVTQVEGAASNAIVVIFSIISQLNDKDINNWFYTKLKSCLLQSDREKFDKYFNFKYLIPGLKFILSNEGFRELCESVLDKNVVAPYARIVKGKPQSVSGHTRGVAGLNELGKLLAVCFMVYCAGESREIEGVKLVVNSLKEARKGLVDNSALKILFTSEGVPIDSEEAIIAQVAHRKMYEFGVYAVPIIEKEYLESGFGEGYLRLFGSGFYRMLVFELTSELRERGLKISGRRREKIQRLVEFESSLGMA